MRVMEKSRIYLQGSNGKTDIENRVMDTGRVEEKVRWKFILPCTK